MLVPKILPGVPFDASILKLKIVYSCFKFLEHFFSSISIEIENHINHNGHSVNEIHEAYNPNGLKYPDALKFSKEQAFKLAQMVISIIIKII